MVAAVAAVLDAKGSLSVHLYYIVSLQVTEDL